MDEIVDIYDEYTGKKTKEFISKNEAHRLGIWHSSIHLIIVSKDKTKILLQKRCRIKKFFPNMWDVSVGGHISHGEDEITALKREMMEELGLDLNNYKYEELGVFKEELTNNGIISREFVHTFIIYDDIDINNIKLHKEEVENVRWFSKEELNKLVLESKVINHIEEYKKLNEILK